MEITQISSALFLFLFFFLNNCPPSPSPVFTRTFRTGGEESQDCIHTVPDLGAGEGVPFQPVPDAQAEDRDSPCPLPLRETDQNLVSKPPDEVEERQQAEEHEHGVCGWGSLQALTPDNEHYENKAKIVISTFQSVVS